MMRASDHPFCSGRFAAMAHRGGSCQGETAENTMAAFGAAVDLGYRYIETDVQATRDGRLVCFHDPTTERLTGTAATIASLTSDEVSSLVVGDDHRVAFLDEVVETFPETRFNIDIKSPEAVEPLVSLITTRQLRERVLVASFSQARISRFRSQTRGEVPTAMAPLGASWSALGPCLSTILASPAVALQVPPRLTVGGINLNIVTRASVERVHSVGKAIHVWTVNDEHDMDALIDLGVDGIITDQLDTLKRVLIRLNLWEDS